MLESTVSTAPESSLFLWLVAAGVAALAAHAGFGWLREARREASALRGWLGIGIAAAALGTGTCSAMVLALSSEALPFALGYPAGRAAAIWLLAVGACLPPCIVLARLPTPRLRVACGLWLAACSAAVQWAWIDAVGFRPGIAWREEVVATALVLLAFGLTSGLGVAFSDGARHGRRRMWWRVGGAVLFGLGLMAGQEILIAGSDLAEQTSSIYQNHLSATLLCLLGGVAVPLGLLLISIDLEVRRQARRRRSRRRRALAPADAPPAPGDVQRSPG